MKHSKNSWAMCGKKMSYETQSKANKKIVKAELRGYKGELRTYECPICFCWHITKKKLNKGDEHECT
jgi:hypothetical protein